MVYSIKKKQPVEWDGILRSFVWCICSCSPTRIWQNMFGNSLFQNLQKCPSSISWLPCVILEERFEANRMIYFPILNEELFRTTESSKSQGRWNIWLTTQLYGDYFTNPWNKDPVLKQPGFNGKYTAFFFMAQFTEILTFQKVMSHFESQNFCSSASSAHLVDLGHGDQVGVSLNGDIPPFHTPKWWSLLSRKKNHGNCWGNGTIGGNPYW